MRSRCALPRLLFLALLIACGPVDDRSRVDGPVVLTLLHTADLHSELDSQAVTIGALEERLGLGLAGGRISLGGVARLASLARRERHSAARVLHLDAGDALSGSAWFERFRGAPELEALSVAGVDAMALGNHELDVTPAELRQLARRSAGFPLLAANYAFTSEGDGITQRHVIFDLAGLKVAVIGLGNQSSVSADVAARFGFSVTDPLEALEREIAALPTRTDVVLVLSHLGHGRDQDVARVSGVTVVLGGHNHFASTALTAIEREPDAPGLISQVGSKGRFVGRADLTLERRLDDGTFEVTAQQFRLLPVDDTLPEDPAVAELLSRYGVPADALLAFASVAVDRASDAQPGFGDLVAESLRRAAPGVDVGLINATAVRAGLPEGLLSESDLVRALPFDDDVVILDLDGQALETLFGDVARRSAARGCRSEAHLAGARLSVDCGACEEDADCRFDAVLTRCVGGECSAEPLRGHGRYRVATSAFVLRSRRYSALDRAVRVASGGRLREHAAALLASAPLCGASCTVDACSSDPRCSDGACETRCPLAQCAAEMIRTGGAETCERGSARCSGLPCLRPFDLPVTFEASSL